VEGYFDKLTDAYRRLNDGKTRLSPLTVDCANGVGAIHLRRLATVLSQFGVKITNDDLDTPGQLNKNCGADYVKTTQSAPPSIQLQPNGRYASFDGDADRIVYYYQDDQGVFKLLDGDKIAGLAAMFLKELVQTAGLNLKVGVVQTAYANGNSTAYLTKVLQVPVSCVQTGVKHLHHEAERYNVGVYFEANGHGTVLFNSEAQSIVQQAQPSTPAQTLALDQLKALMDLINQTVGDAISDMLLVETILTHRQWTCSMWDQAYTDLPSRLVKVVVENRFIFETTKADTQLVQPKGLQARINGIVSDYTNGRSFVRPSGTEDVVRVYAEAATRAECDQLAYRVAGMVFDHAGGKGTRPTEFL
jgi:phosphoacetylglucosamine mutase